LQSRLNANWILGELTLGHIWDADLVRNETIFREIITTAQVLCRRERERGRAGADGSSLRESWRSSSS
jgi:hypothetical protein